MNIWQVLGIEPTTDSKTIKRAYATQLKKIDQETQVNLFDQLQNAYQSALAEIGTVTHIRQLAPDETPLCAEIAEESNTSEPPVSDSAVDDNHWILQEFFQLLNDSVSRQDVEKWNQWLHGQWGEELAAIDYLSLRVFSMLVDFFVEPDFEQQQYAIPDVILVQFDQLFHWSSDERLLLNHFYEHEVEAVLAQITMSQRVIHATEKINPIPDVLSSKNAAAGADEKYEFIEAGFWWRSVAAVIDFGIVLALLLLLIAGGFFADSRQASFWFWCFFGVYSSFFESFAQASAGKMMLGMRVRQQFIDVDQRGSENIIPLSGKALMLRFVFKVLSVYTLGLLFLICLFRQDKKTLHDILSHTLVVRKRKLSSLAG